MSQKPHLDDFFAAARREEPVITHDEIGELINARHTQATPTQHITWKGIGMTTVGFGLAAVLSYFAFFSSGTPAPSASNRPAVATSVPSASTPEVRTLVAPKVDAQAPAQPVEAVKPTTPVPPVPPVPALRVEAPIKVDEVRIVEPSAGDMKRLGLKVDGGREVVVVQKVGKKFFVVSYAAKPFRISSQLEVENPTDIEPTETLPVFVTNLDGTGILTASAPDENTSITTSELHSTKEESGKKERTVERTRTNIVVNTDADDSDVDVSTDFEVVVPPIILDKDGYFYQTNTDSMVAMTVVDDARSTAQAEISVDMPEKRARVFIKSADGGIDIDASTPEAQRKLRIALDEAANGIQIIGVDSGMTHKQMVHANIVADSLKMKFQSFKMDSLTQFAKDIQIKIMTDTNMQNLFKELRSGTFKEDLAREMENVKEHMAKLKGLKFEISDSIHGELSEAMKQLKHAQTEVKIHKHMPGSKKRIAKVFGPVHKGKAKAFIIPGFSELRAQINELVPMRIDLNADKGQGLIFWYEPNDAPAAPKQETQAAASSSIESVSINPNPAQNHATVRMTLKDAHAVTVSIHDILGKRLLEAGQLNASAAGEFTHELDLSTLSQGMYLVVLTADNGEQRIERILVNK